MADEYNNAEVSKRIKQLLASSGETEYGLAKILEIRPSSISQAMRGINNWSTRNLIAISKFFRVSLDWLVWGRVFNETEQLAKMRDELFTTKENLQYWKREYERLKKAFMYAFPKKFPKEGEEET